MTKEEIIKLAIEHTVSGLKFDEDGLVRFAKLVAEHERDKLIDAAMKAAEKGIDTAITLEREACAKIADNFAMTSQYKTQRSLAEWCANSIRARGQA